MTACAFCDGACAGADLTQLLIEPRRWLWLQLAAAADKRGDADLIAGTVSIVTPDSADERAAVLGLVGALAPKRRKTVNLVELTRKLRIRAPALTPGAVAAHALGRRLAVRAAEETARSLETERLGRAFLELHASFKHNVPRLSGGDLWSALRRSGWATRLLSFAEPERVVAETAMIVAALPSPPERVDRRRLAAECLGDPHGLDEGTPTGSFVLAVVAAARRTSARDGPRRAWSSLGVECDDITGGLIALGIVPLGWSVPTGDVVTIPPRVLDNCTWPPAPSANEWVFITENPSIVTAAADKRTQTIRLLCTSGTPSLRELHAIDRLAAAGWRVAVRADFDEAGLRHVNSLLRTVRGAVTWRMSSSDYRQSVREEGEHEGSDAALSANRIPSTPWDPTLASAMLATGVPAFEEALLPALLDDLAKGEPCASDIASARSGLTTREWLFISETRHALVDDPLLDWLTHHGRAAGFSPDGERPGYDPRTDFNVFLREKRRDFKAAVVALLAAGYTVRRLNTSVTPSRADIDATLEAMHEGVPIIAHAVVEDALRGLRGGVDLLIRSDVLNETFPGLLTPVEARLRAQRLRSASFHYRPIVIQYRTIDVGDAGDAVGARARIDRTRMRMLALALGSMQGLTPPAGYLLGRSYKQRALSFDGCLDKLARVDVLRDRGQLDRAAEDAMAWLRLLKREGARWRPLPSPAVAQLFPNMRNTDDAPWHAAKADIANALGELTLLPAVTPEHRRRAHEAGIFRVDDPRTTASALGVSRTQALRVDDVINANRAMPGRISPARFTQGRAFLDAPAPLELFVDVETVSNADDDFATMPRMNARAQIVMLGCGYFAGGDWVFRQWVVDAIEKTPEHELKILDDWIDWLLAAVASRGVDLGACRLCHWSAAEPVAIEKAYIAARAHRPGASATLPWFDVYRDIMVANRASIAGSFDLRLKSVCSALRLPSMANDDNESGVADGLAAMVAMWRANRERDAAGRLSTHPLVQQVAQYNARDVRVLAELVRFLRTNC